MRATCTRTEGVRHELGEDKLYGHIKPRKTRARFLEFCHYLRSLIWRNNHVYDERLRRIIDRANVA